jgi:hypothetical protein
MHLPHIEYVLDMRQMHLDQGGRPEDFNKWLEEQGCKQLGVCTIISDDLEIYAKIKYA